MTRDLIVQTVTKTYTLINVEVHSLMLNRYRNSSKHSNQLYTDFNLTYNPCVPRGGIILNWHFTYTLKHHDRDTNLVSG